MRRSSKTVNLQRAIRLSFGLEAFAILDDMLSENPWGIIYPDYLQKNLRAHLQNTFQAIKGEGVHSRLTPGSGNTRVFNAAIQGLEREGFIDRLAHNSVVDKLSAIGMN